MAKKSKKCLGFVVRKWSKEEERLLAKIWVEVSKDKDIENDHFEEHFWNQILEMFNLRSDREPRRKKMLKGKWTRINGDCQKFNDFYKYLQRRSGENDPNHLENAKTNFENWFGNKSYMHVHVWEILRHYPNWDARCQLTLHVSRIYSALTSDLVPTAPKRAHLQKNKCRLQR